MVKFSFQNGRKITQIYAIILSYNAALNLFNLRIIQNIYRILCYIELN